MTLTQQKAQQYLIDSIDFDGYELEKKPRGNEQKVQATYKIFMDEVGKWNVPRVGLQKAVQEWLQGLCMVRIAFINYDIIQLAKKWGTLEKNATESREDKFINMYFQVMAANLCQLFKKYKAE